MKKGLLLLTESRFFWIILKHGAVPKLQFLEQLPLKTAVL
jgi:hypothetical protein